MENNYKFKDMLRITDLALPLLVKEKFKSEQAEKFSRFILARKAGYVTEREICYQGSMFSPPTAIELTTELNVFTNAELKEFIADLKKAWLKKLTEYGEGNL